MGAVYLERHNFETQATNALDGGTFVISSRASMIRTEIVQDATFLPEFLNERFFFGLFGPLNPDDDNFIIRWALRMGYRIKIQHTEAATFETTLGELSGAKGGGGFMLISRKLSCSRKADMLKQLKYYSRLNYGGTIVRPVQPPNTAPSAAKV
jgi:hypothetical protein